ncbi:MAG TPA: DUF11 domain-containing protein [Actinomycetota bacterium]|nr:DUF11 domain-containing protein [Actinomycetota bacterium]
MDRHRLWSLVAVSAVTAALLAFFVTPGTAANASDVWLTNSTASGAGHAHEPHLANTTIYLHGSDLTTSSGTFDIASIPGTGSGKTIWSGLFWATANGTDVITQLDGAALVADAIAQDSAVANPNQGYHFKITLFQSGATPSVATAATKPGDTKTKTFWVNGSEASPSPSLTVTKTADAASVTSGAAVGFTITAATGASGFANDVSINDPLPSGDGLDWSISPAYSGQGTCTITGTPPSQTLSCSIGDLNGTSVSVHVHSSTVAGTTAALAPLTLTNEACASFDLGEDNAGEDQPQAESAGHCSTAQTVVDPAAPDLTIAKTADAALAPAGSLVGFTITVGNPGPGVALAVTVSDPLPATGTGAWSISPAYGGPGTCSLSGSAPNQHLTCALGNLAPGVTATVHVSAPTPATPTIALTNVATASATNNDPVSSMAHTGTTTAHLTITKVADAVTTTAGSPVGFTITVGNTGSDAATGATLADPLPAFDGASWSISPAYSGPGTCTVTGASSTQTLSCALGDLASGATATVHVATATPSTVGLTLTNLATASATNDDPVTATAVTHSLLPGQVLPATGDPGTPGTQVLGESLTRPALGEVLPFTGGPSPLLFALAALLLLAGTVVLLIARQRQPLVAETSAGVGSTGQPGAEPGSPSGPKAPWVGTAARTTRAHWATSIGFGFGKRRR